METQVGMAQPSTATSAFAEKLTTESPYENPLRAINNLEPRLNCSKPCHQMGTLCLQQGHFNPDATGDEASKPNLCSPWLDRCSAKRTMCKYQFHDSLCPAKFKSTIIQMTVQLKSVIIQATNQFLNIN